MTDTQRRRAPSLGDGAVGGSRCRAQKAREPAWAVWTLARSLKALVGELHEQVWVLESSFRGPCGEGPKEGWLEARTQGESRCHRPREDGRPPKLGLSPGGGVKGAGDWESEGRAEAKQQSPGVRGEKEGQAGGGRALGLSDGDFGLSDGDFGLRPV